jgi:hypothetical protein
MEARNVDKAAVLAAGCALGAGLMFVSNMFRSETTPSLMKNSILPEKDFNCEPCVQELLSYPLKKPCCGDNTPRLNKTGEAHPEFETLTTVPLLTSIYNGRNGAESLDIYNNGFCLVTHNSAVSNFASVEELHNIYYGEMEALVKSVTGAEKCFLFDHTIRRVGENSRNTATKASAVVPEGGFATEGACIVAWLPLTCNEQVLRGYMETIP